MKKQKGLDVVVRDTVAKIVGKMELPKKKRKPLVATPLKVSLGELSGFKGIKK